ncbi:CHAD domain-containing protein [Arthrobacter gandavensis]|uniref:CHAD domain-containing protein n=1 Tax=Arthrobacter gandavensis TaxID=169960 RepID=UPI0018903175|nr:CHAD domain-containing protein [Arthrobacter gandavensis]MBF4993451.1 CHAD domain-containing protein [Arthrobacter gandavensis]
MASATDLPAAPVAGPDGTAGDALLRYVAEQYAEMLRQEGRLRTGEADAIHKMRVSTRRLRSVLASYRKLLPEQPAKQIRAELKWLAQVLGAARDAQVMRHRLLELVASQQDDLVKGPVSARIDAELTARYAEAAQTVHRELGAKRYAALVRELGELLEDPQLTGTASRSARKVGRRLIRRDLRRLRRRVRKAREENDDARRAKIFHEARKDAKRLRYAAEAYVPVGGERATAMVEAAETVQKALGEHQDSVVTRELLVWLGAHPGRGGSGFTYGRLHAVEEQQGRAAEQDFRRLWQGFAAAHGW